MSLSLESFRNSTRGQLPQLEGGASIILIRRETFSLSGTQIVLPLFEVDEGPAPDLSPRDSQTLEWSDVGTQLDAAQILYC
jgi:hypothetical protein